MVLDAVKDLLESGGAWPNEMISDNIFEEGKISVACHAAVAGNRHAEVCPDIVVIVGCSCPGNNMTLNVETACRRARIDLRLTYFKLCEQVMYEQTGIPVCMPPVQSCMGSKEHGVKGTLHSCVPHLSTAAWSNFPGSSGSSLAHSKEKRKEVAPSSLARRMSFSYLQMLDGSWLHGFQGYQTFFTYTVHYSSQEWMGNTYKFQKSLDVLNASAYCFCPRKFFFRMK